MANQEQLEILKQDIACQQSNQAVFAAYGWESTLSDEEILEQLLKLNLERGR